MKTKQYFFSLVLVLAGFFWLAKPSYAFSWNDVWNKINPFRERESQASETTNDEKENVNDLKKRGPRRIKRRIARKALKQKCGDNHGWAMPGKPLSLSGEGIVCGRGGGRVAYKIEKGQAVMRGLGIVAVKGDVEIKKQGFGAKREVGDWTFYWGRGRIKAEGENFSLVGWLAPGNTRAKGKGSVTFRGGWNARWEKMEKTSLLTEDSVNPPADIEVKNQPLDINAQEE